MKGECIASELNIAFESVGEYHEIDSEERGVLKEDN